VKSISVALTLLIPITVLSACSPKPEPVTYSAVPTPKPALVLPKISTLNLKTVDYIVVTRENVDEVFNDLEKNGKSVVLFAIDANGYEQLSLNMASVLELVSQQKSIIAAYERYYVTD
jgi:hypothetical protein